MASTTLPKSFDNTSPGKNMLVKKWQKLISDLVVPCSHLVSPLGSPLTSVANGQQTEKEMDVLREDINQIRTLVTALDTEMLQFKPVNPSNLWANSFCTPVYEHNNLFEMSVFGLRFSGHSIPLHDHPTMYGFIRPLHGRIRISSFSWLEPEEERKLIAERNSHLKLAKERPTRYNGQIVLSGSCKEPPIAVLGPNNANLHTIEAMDDGAAFFDLLVPGYRCNRTCTYYAVSDQKEPTTIGELVWLEELEDVPSDFSMQELK